MLGIKETRNKKKEEPFWKRTIESKINALCKDVSLIERWETRMLRKKVTKPGWIICIESKGKGIKEQLKNLTNGLKQKLNLKRYKKKVNQSRLISIRNWIESDMKRI